MTVRSTTVRSCRGAAALLTLILLPQLASAGPIEWDFRITSRTDPPGDRVYLGEYQLRFGPSDPQSVYVFTGRPAGGSGSTSGSVTNMVVAGTGKQDWEFTTRPGGGPTEFEFRFDITDRASGESGSAVYTVRPSFSNGFPDTYYGEVSIWIDEQATFDLGGNRYDLVLRTIEDASSHFIMADVTVTPSATTPEPGTLALAGVGLAPLIGAFVRRLRRPHTTPA
jgi:hypothetical protein